MTRGLAVLVAAVAMLAVSGNAQAESFDLREIMGGGPDFRGYSGGASPCSVSALPVISSSVDAPPLRSTLAAWSTACAE